MKLFTRILLILLVIIVLALVAAFFLPSRLQISKEVVIDQPQNVVFQELNDVSRFNSFSPWYDLDTTATYVYSDQTEGVGAFLQWDGNQVGKGTYTITESVPYDRIDVGLVFDESSAQTAYILTETPEGTQVQWTYDAELEWPIERYIGLYFNDLLENNYATGLATLKENLENRPYTTDIEVEEVQQEALPVMGVRAVYNETDDIGTAMGGAFAQILEYVERNSIDMQQARFVSIYSSIDQSIPQPDFLAGIISDQADNKPNSNIEPYTIPAGVYIRGIHRGAYTNLSESYQALASYINSREDRQIAGDVFEEYITDPAAVPDTAAWVTHIYFRVEENQ